MTVVRIVGEHNTIAAESDCHTRQGNAKSRCRYIDGLGQMILFMFVPGMLIEIKGDFGPCIRIDPRGPCCLHEAQIARVAADKGLIL